MSERQKLFDSFMNEYMKLGDEDKSKEVVEKQKKLLAFLVKYATDRGIPFEILKSREITDLIEKDIPTSTDYFEAIMVYTQNIEDLVGNILQHLN